MVREVNFAPLPPPQSVISVLSRGRTLLFMECMLTNVRNYDDS